MVINDDCLCEFWMINDEMEIQWWMLNNCGWSSMLIMRRNPGWYWTDLAIERCTSCAVASQRGHSQRRHSSQSDRRSSKGPLMVAEFYSIQWIQWFLSNGSIININSSPKNTLGVSADYLEFVCLFVVDFISIVVGWSHFAGAFCSDHLIWTVQWSVAAGTGSGWNGSGIWTPYSWWTRNCHMAPCASFWACLCFQRAFPWKHGLIVGTSYGGRL